MKKTIRFGNVAFTLTRILFATIAAEAMPGPNGKLLVLAPLLFMLLPICSYFYRKERDNALKSRRRPLYFTAAIGRFEKF